ncbi:YceI family protein, partial [bacterium]|nr:YceI family protein [bacterium]
MKPKKVQGTNPLLAIVFWSTTFNCCSTFAEDFFVDLEKSRVFIRVDSVGVGHQHGIEGKLKESELDLSGHGRLVFDMTSFTADTERARSHVGVKGKISDSDKKQTNANMLSAQVLDVAQFPTATFEVKSLVAMKKEGQKEPTEFQISGEFTLHGVKRPLTFATKIEPITVDASIIKKMSGSFLIKQTDYGIKPYSAFGGLSKVKDELKIWGDLVLV